MEDLVINANLVIPGRELSYTAVRASGPGGQNVNKLATKIELHFDFESSQVLRADIKLRLKRLARGRLDASGRIRIVSQAGRSQRQNLDRSLGELALLVRRSLVVPRRRVATKPSKTAREKRLSSKRHQAEKKRVRSGPVEA